MLSRRAVLAGGVAASLAGCAKQRRGDRLSFWAMSYEGDYSPLLMPAFTAATGLQVDIQSVPYTAAHEKLLTAFAGGTLPDVLMLPNGWTNEFAMIGAIRPVASEALLDDLFPGTAATTRYAGRPYAVPWAVAPQVQFYRRDLLANAGYDTPPTRWAEWRAMLRALQRRRPDAFALLSLLNWWDTLFAFAAQTGAPPLRDADTRGNFASDGFRAALAFYLSLFDEGLAPKVSSTEVPDPIGAFAAGRFAVYPIGPSLLKDLERRRADIDPALWATAQLPGPDGPGPLSGVASALTMTTQARDPAAAQALLAFLTSPAQELRLQGYIGNLPARRSAWAAPRLADDPKLAAFASQLERPANGPNIVEWEQIRGAVQVVAERLVRHQLTLDQAVTEMNRQTDAILAKRRWMVESGRLAA